MQSLIYLLNLFLIWVLCCFEMGSHVAQAGLQFAVYLKIILNFRSSCIHLLCPTSHLGRCSLRHANSVHQKLLLKMWEARKLLFSPQWDSQSLHKTAFLNLFENWVWGSPALDVLENRLLWEEMEIELVCTRLSLQGRQSSHVIESKVWGKVLTGLWM